jgi:putative ABC transport system permease protein
MKASMVRAGNILKVGLSAIARNKLRSALTALGIVIGVACVIAMVALGQGASNSIQQSVQSLGTNYIMILPGAVTQSGARVFSSESSLTVEDAAAIRSELDSVAYVSPGVRTSAQIIGGDTNWSTTIHGVGIEWPAIRAWNTSDGVFFSEGEVRSGAMVCVLGATVAENLFPDGGAVGQNVRIRKVPFRVVGVLERKGGSAMGQDQDDTVIAPYTTVMKRLMGTPRINVIYVSAASDAAVPRATREIEELLRQRNRLQPHEDNNFMIRSQEEIATAAASTTRTLSILLGSVAAISLLVGGIGIMNIMLVSVTERTREIGIRMAIGAKGKHVLLQFLLEAVVLSLGGGILGILLGVGVSAAISRYVGWPTAISAQAVALAFTFSFAIGVFFGFYPARKAAKLDPIDALRYE